MLKLYPLFSGSSGNSTYIEFENKKGILVDIGKSAKKIHRAAEPVSGRIPIS